MTNDFIKAIGNKNVKGVQAVYMDKATGEIKVTAEYSMPILRMVMEEIDQTNKYQFCEIINA